MWVSGLGWLGWDGRRWDAATEVEVTEAVRQYLLDRFAEAMEYMRNGQGGKEAIDGWRSMLGAGRMRAVLNLARGIVERKAADLDQDLDLINTPSGVVDLRTGELLPADPSLLMTKITSGSYRPGFTHIDWAKALEALPKEERDWLQCVVGQGITGHPNPNDFMAVLQGSGENGKSAITTDGILPALGDYASVASTKLFQSSKSEHSTERADLRGKRLVIIEELTEGKSIDISALKQILGVAYITARFIRQDNITFRASHTLIATTNYIPLVNETDWGTWRRFALLRFPYTFRKPGQALRNGLADRPGDLTLKRRMKRNESGQHDAIVTWAVEGAIRFHTDPDTALRPTSRVEADTQAWRIEADRIMGFWKAWLMADPGRCILSTELSQVFNAWLAANGHLPWSKETFGPRFKQHDETINTASGWQRSLSWRLSQERRGRSQSLRFRADLTPTWESGSGTSRMPKTPPSPKVLLTRANVETVPRCRTDSHNQ
jgi:P4 family phage/plasmid primase-like protien